MTDDHLEIFNLKNSVIFVGTCMAVFTRSGYVAILTLCIFLILQIYQAQEEGENRQNAVIEYFNLLHSKSGGDLEYLCNSADFIVFFGDLMPWRPFDETLFDEMVTTANESFSPTLSHAAIEQIHMKLLNLLSQFANFPELHSHVAVAQERLKRLLVEQ